MLSFLFAFFLKISETLKAHISGMEADINKRAFVLVFNRLSYQPIKKLSKISMHRNFESIGSWRECQHCQLRVWNSVGLVNP